MITNITIEIEGKKLEMTLEAARHLYNDLRNIFDKYQSTYRPYYVPVQNPNPWWQSLRQTTCGAQGSNGLPALINYGKGYPTLGNVCDNAQHSYFH